MFKGRGEKEHPSAVWDESATLEDLLTTGGWIPLFLSFFQYMNI